VDFDRYFLIRYQRDGKRKEEGLGWASEGWTAEVANEKLAELKRAARTGDGPQRLNEAREIEDARLEAAKEERAEAAKAAITFGEFFQETYLPHAKSYKKGHTWESEERLYRLWFKPVIGDVPIRKITLEKHLKAIDWRMQKGQREDTSPEKSKPRPLSAKSRQHALALLRQVWNYGKRSGVTSGDWPGKVMSKKERPKVNNQKDRFLTREEADMLLTELAHASTKLHDIALLSLHTGMRADEVFSLTWGHVNLANDTLKLVDTKNGENRTVYLTPGGKDVLAARNETAKEHGEDGPGHLLFLDRKGNKIVAPSAAFARVVDRLGLNDGITDSRQKVTFHTLRHTYASWLVEAGVDLYTVSKLLGHKSLAMTQRYAHVGPNAQRQAVRVLTEHLKAPVAQLQVVKGGEG
jgi:integrase